MAAASDPVVIASAARTPLGRFMGELSPFSAHQLGSHVICAYLPAFFVAGVLCVVAALIVLAISRPPKPVAA